ncbi:MAG: outer membrane protein assembly factor BamA [Candidatus Omnitrophica bacterium]|nr:outer membrane protein assembly factor BamA [Candidatus Omnitrophota bacterium]
MRKIAAGVSICLLALLVSAGSGTCAEGTGKIVKEIRVKNNKAISEATIVSKIKTKVGEPFNQDIINDDLKRLYAMGFFADVSVDVEDYDNGLRVNIVVAEKPVIGKINFQGNKGIASRKLEKSMQLKPGDMLDQSKLAQDVNELKNLYNKNGFQQVAITYEISPASEANTADVNITVNENVRFRIKKVSVTGNTVVKSKTLIDLMATKPAAWYLLRQGYFDEVTFEGDIEKIKRYYQDLGYLDADVKADFAYDDKTGQMVINLTVVEGKRYITGTITIQGNLIFAEADVRKKMKMKTKSPFSHSGLRADMESVREYYYGKGYMNVEIEVDRKLDPSQDVVDIVYTINAGEVVNVGRIDIKGNTKTKDVVIRRELRLYPGDRYDGDKLRRSKERLYNLGFFEDVYFDTVSTPEKNVKDLIIDVKETKTGEFAFGGGYSSIDQFLGFVQVTQRNFDILNFNNFTGAGQNLSLRASLGMVRNDYDISWTDPWIMGYPLLFGFDLFKHTHAQSASVGYAYQEDRIGGDLRVGKELLEYLRTDLTYTIEEIKIGDLIDNATQDLINEQGTNTVSSLLWSATFDTRDNVYVPKRGVKAEVIVENAGGFLGFDKTYFKNFYILSYYYTFFDKVTLEAKGRTGLANSYGDTNDVPIYARYFAGGADTIRGYRERRVGPRDPGSSEPIGGEGLIVGNLEATFPLFEKVIKGAVFYDVGNVYRRIEDYGKLEGGFKQGTGVGIRVKTPIGPLKLDAGYPLSDNNDDKKQIEWYFSMSHGF